MRFCTAAFAILLALIGSSELAAQQAAGFPDRFDSEASCEAALLAGQVRYYQPSFFRPQPLRSNERIVPLEHDACVRMQIVGRIAWVPQRQGTEFVYQGTTPVRRNDCGNRVYALSYPVIPIEGVTAEVERPQPAFTDRTIFYQEEQREQPVIDDGGFPWGPVIGGALAAGVTSGLVYMCVTDWCVGEEEEEEKIRIRIFIDDAAAFASALLSVF